MRACVVCVCVLCLGCVVLCCLHGVVCACVSLWPRLLLCPVLPPACSRGHSSIRRLTILEIEDEWAKGINQGAQKPSAHKAAFFPSSFSLFCAAQRASRAGSPSALLCLFEAERLKQCATAASSPPQRRRVCCPRRCWVGCARVYVRCDK
jgi:hypothetical protein